MQDKIKRELEYFRALRKRCGDDIKMQYIDLASVWPCECRP